MSDLGMKRLRVLLDGELVYVADFTPTWTIAPMIDEASRRGSMVTGQVTALRLSPAAYDEAETYLNNGPWTPSADAGRLWHPQPPPRPELYWRAVPIVRDEQVPWIDVEVGS